MRILGFSFFLFFLAVNAFATEREAFRGQWSGKVVYAYQGYVADCDVKLSVFSVQGEDPTELYATDNSVVCRSRNPKISEFRTDMIGWNKFYQSTELNRLLASWDRSFTIGYWSQDALQFNSAEHSYSLIAKDSRLIVSVFKFGGSASGVLERVR